MSAVIVKTANEPNALAPIDDQAIILSNFDCINRKMILPAQWSEIRLGAFFSMTGPIDTVAQNIGTEENIGHNGVPSNAIWFGIKDDSDLIPGTVGSKFLGMSTYNTSTYLYTSFLTSTTTTNLYLNTRAMMVGRTSATGSNFHVHGTFSTGSTFVRGDLYNSSTRPASGMVSFVSDGTTGKVGVGFSGVSIRKSGTSAIIQQIGYIPASTDIVYTKGITDLSENSLRAYLQMAQLANNPVTVTGDWTADTMPSVTNWYIKHPFTIVRMRIHAYGFITLQ